jgi:hypothetical protein
MDIHTSYHKNTLLNAHGQGPENDRPAIQSLTVMRPMPMVCHQDAEAMYRLGFISDDRMKEFDEMCLAPSPNAPKKTHASIRQGPASVYACPRKA